MNTQDLINLLRKQTAGPSRAVVEQLDNNQLLEVWEDCEERAPSHEAAVDMFEQALALT